MKKGYEMARDRAISTEIIRRDFLEAIEHRVPTVIEQLETEVAPLMTSLGLDPLKSSDLWRLLRPLFCDELLDLPAQQLLKKLQLARISQRNDLQSSWSW
ncbi:MAG: hypothetical protein ABI977_19325 [Acidobacteriota bacterium]